ncbi:hypothetical protein GHJ84_32170 [Sinorhizobium meliloti]|nr:hypothetical protein [Sinorhizobium meliloti]
MVDGAAFSGTSIAIGKSILARFSLPQPARRYGLPSILGSRRPHFDIAPEDPLNISDFHAISATVQATVLALIIPLAVVLHEFVLTGKKLAENTTRFFMAETRVVLITLSSALYLIWVVAFEAASVLAGIELPPLAGAIEVVWLVFNLIVICAFMQQVYVLLHRPNFEAAIRRQTFLEIFPARYRLKRLVKLGMRKSNSGCHRTRLVCRQKLRTDAIATLKIVLITFKGFHALLLRHTVGKYEGAIESPVLCRGICMMDHHSLAELIRALERLLVVAFAGLSLWFGWRLVCPPRSMNGPSSLRDTWQSMLGRLALGLFAVYFIVFGSFLLVTVFASQQMGSALNGAAQVSIPKTP